MSIWAGILNIISNGIKRSPLFGGSIYYVSDSVGDDTNDGKTPNSQFKTIGKAISELIEGDAINIMAGTYTETGLDLDVNACELWFEIGAIIDPASGTALTISGDYCKIKGNHIIKPASGEIGLFVSGNYCRVNDGRVLQGGTGLKITGIGSVVIAYACGQQTSIAYDIQGNATRMKNCSTVGVGATYGYKINNSSDTGVLKTCTSVGHTTAGFYIGSGSINWTIFNCSSGCGDGKWYDADQTNSWQGFSFADVKTSLATLDANNETKSYNVARIYGIVKIKAIHIRVITALSPNIRNFYLNIWDGSTNVPISDSTGLTLDNAPAGSLITRIKDSTELLDYQSGATCFVSENTNFRDVQTEVIVGTKGDGTPTYLRMTYTTTDTPSSGQIRGYIEWEPISIEGFVELL